jgi:2-C-methyl-D-erythritol 4-phosphate cytidylyltransferase
VLNALHAEGEWALVHDAARPCLTHEDLDALIAAAMASGGAILGSRVRDTMKRTDAAGNILATVDREQLWHALTPQMFLVRPLKRALEEGWRSALPSPMKPPPWNAPVSPCAWWKGGPTTSR